MEKENKELKEASVLRPTTPQKEAPCEKTAAKPYSAAKKKKSAVKHAQSLKRKKAAVASKKVPAAMNNRTALASGKPPFDYAINLPADTTLGDAQNPIGSAHEENAVYEGPLGIFAFQTRPEFPGNEPGNGKPEHDGGNDRDGEHDADRDHDAVRDSDNDRHGREEAREHGEGHEHEEHGDDRHDHHGKND